MQYTLADLGYRRMTLYITNLLPIQHHAHGAHRDHESDQLGIVERGEYIHHIQCHIEFGLRRLLCMVRIWSGPQYIWRGSTLQKAEYDSRVMLDVMSCMAGAIFAIIFSHLAPVNFVWSSS